MAHREDERYGARTGPETSSLTVCVWYGPIPADSLVNVTVSDPMAST